MVGKVASRGDEVCKECKQFPIFCVCQASLPASAVSPAEIEAGVEALKENQDGVTLNSLAIYASTLKRRRNQIEANKKCCRILPAVLQRTSKTLNSNEFEFEQVFFLEFRQLN